MTPEPFWMDKFAVLAMHKEHLAEHGGADGIRDEGLLDSALAKPRNVFAYENDVSLFRLAASYAFGIARNHAFVDGNKRTALIVSSTFLLINGWDLEASREKTYFTFLHLAEGNLTEEELTAWFGQHAVKNDSF